MMRLATIRNHQPHRQAIRDDSAYEELQKWGRYTVVSDPAKADMVLTVGVQVHSTGATANT
jgi:hypothetical protein